MNSQSNNEKVWLLKGKTTKSSVTFRRNKPNSPIVQTDLTSCTTMNYTIFASLTKVKNKPNQTQFKANTNLSSNVAVGGPIPERLKMNLNIYYTKVYNNLFRWRGEKTNPIQSQYKPSSILSSNVVVGGPILKIRICFHHQVSCGGFSRCSIFSQTNYPAVALQGPLAGVIPGPH